MAPRSRRSPAHSATAWAGTGCSDTAVRATGTGERVTPERGTAQGAAGASMAKGTTTGSPRSMVQWASIVPGPSNSSSARTRR